MGSRKSRGGRRIADLLVLCLIAGLLPGIAHGAPVAGTGPRPTEQLTEADASAAARASGERVEVGSLRGETRDVFALPSGQFELVQHQRPVRTRKDGKWLPVDTTLTRLADGGIAPIASSVDIRFSGGGDEPFARMSRAGEGFALSWPGRLPAPQVDGDTATYPEVLPGVDLQVRADVDGFTHLLVVKTPQAARNPALARVSLKLDAPRLVVKADASGVLQATDARSGGAVFEAPAPLMWDSAGATTAPVAVGLGAGELTLVPDPGLLTAPGTRFPVYIDPVWKTVSESARLMVSSGYPTTSYYNFTGTQGVGLCDVQFDGACAKDQRKRIFYRMPISAFAGKFVISAEFTAFETHAFNCGNPTVVQLWHTGGFGSSSTWNSTDDNWTTNLASRDVAYCSRTPVEFGGTALRDVVRAAANRKDSAITFGLRAYSESSMSWWKRFAEDASLRVQYNTPPPQPLMKNLSMSPGGPCVDWTSPPTVNRLPTLYAILHDADSGSAAKLQAQFRIAWDSGNSIWTAPLTAAKTTGSTFQVTAPSSIPRNKVMSWYVRTWDGYQWSPWSPDGAATGCYFSYDATAPSAPSVSSTAYPPSDPENPDDPWSDGVGRYGSFTISTTSADVNRYWVGVNASPTQSGEYRPAAPGGSVTVRIAPTRAGVNFLYVKALDAAGNASAPATYMFRVNSGSAPKAHWELDEPAGATTLTAVTRAGVPAITAHANAGVTLGVDGQVGTAMRGNGTPSGYAETAGPVLDTRQTFALAAWVRLANTDRVATVINQDGAVMSGFTLGYSKDVDRWTFARRPLDAITEGPVRALSAAAPDPGEWTHLLAVHDAVAHTIRLYLNGSLQQEAAFTATWNATGSMAIGRGKFNGAMVDFFPGDIDDVRVFDRLVTAEEAADLFQQHPVLAGRWKLNTDGADDSGHGRGLALGGNARVDQTAGWLGNPQGGLVLDGAGDFAATAGPVVKTNRSFTVAGWATAATTPTGKAALFSQEGTVHSGFTVRYNPAAADGAGGWQVEMPGSDAAGATMQAADHSAYRWQLAWDHVAIVYDSFSDAMHLYVNGALEQSETNVSTRWHTAAFDATRAFQLGRSKTGGVWGEYWPGVIDDVWAFSGVLSQEQIQALAGYTELPSGSPF